MTAVELPEDDRRRRLAAMREAGEDPPISAANRLARSGPALTLTAMTALYFALFGFLVWRQHSNFGTFGFDLGIRDQGIWLVAHGHSPFMTVRGLDFFAENVEPISLLFVPFYWLGAGPHLLILVHTAAVAAGAVPLWLLGRDRFHRPWLALVPALAYLLYPAVHWVTWWAYHPDSLAITPLLFAWWLAARRRWAWYSVAVMLALACKEDVALAVLMLGLAVAFAPRLVGESRAPKRALAPGLLTAAVAAGWFLLGTQVIIPWRNHHAAPFYQSFFPAFGHNTPEIVYNIVRHPSRVAHLALLHDRLFYDLQVFLPVACLAFFGLPALLIAGPQFGVNTIVQVQHAATIESQYASLVIAGTFLGTVEGMAWLARRLGRWTSRERVLEVLAGVLIVSSLACTTVWGLSPISRRFHSGLWVAHTANAAELRGALKLIGARDGMSVTYYITPHVTHRRYVYEFPNPWINSNFGNTDQDLGQADKVDWLLLDRRTLRSGELALLERLTRSDGPFKIIEDTHGILAARRVRRG